MSNAYTEAKLFEQPAIGLSEGMFDQIQSLHLSGQVELKTETA